eukprot:TRINITY_DN14696_c0_g1_i1.p1 TRINITY_DN14696_c0_g1~~TRINITY_DN14696_c0_g1_i1.p1  ORF type:complete len:479 (-),score=95.49 TRINITY_DN14696_c0_g1_i1:190-1602(-)
MESEHQSPEHAPNVESDHVTNSAFAMLADEVRLLRNSLQELRSENESLKHEMFALKTRIGESDLKAGSPVGRAKDSEMNRKVLLDVGGQPYSTTLSTLTKHDSMLSNLFSGKFAVHEDESGRVFIDRDGALFAHVLTFLRTDRWELPADPALVDRIRREAEYFGLAFPPAQLVPKSTRELKAVEDVDALSMVAFAGMLVVQPVVGGPLQIFKDNGRLLRTIQIPGIGTFVPIGLFTSLGRLFGYSGQKLLEWDKNFNFVGELEMPKRFCPMVASGSTIFGATGATVDVLRLSNGRLEVTHVFHTGNQLGVTKMLVWNRLLVVLVENQLELKIYDGDNDWRLAYTRTAPASMSMGVLNNELCVVEEKCGIVLISRDLNDFAETVIATSKPGPDYPSFRRIISVWGQFAVVVSKSRMYFIDMKGLNQKTLQLDNDAVNEAVVVNDTSMAVSTRDLSLVFYHGSCETTGSMEL